ncbi:MAG: hypothetical protein A2107_00565 [Verrucomicrobia bacterium GWF2_62_7]|nr:MAG: hypothetical protein A2107_00565 [Verrucomicrobia bacterium GWF2_62_7]
MKTEAKQRLLDALEACRAVEQFAQGKDFTAYQADEMLRAAVERKLEVIGEAFTKLADAEPELAERFPDFRKIVGLRNRIIHGYDTVDDEIIWDVVENKLPALRRQVEKFLK